MKFKRFIDLESISSARFQLPPHQYEAVRASQSIIADGISRNGNSIDLDGLSP